MVGGEGSSGLRDVGGEEEDQEVLASHMREGQRCEVRTSLGAKRGLVRVVGQDLEGLPAGWFVGVEYDEPVGKNDGSINGVRHFECGMGYGAFVRPSFVSVGEDFVPFEDEFSDFSEEDEL